MRKYKNNKRTLINSLVMWLKKHKYSSLGMLVCLSLGFLSGILSGSAAEMDWYQGLRKPAIAVPKWLFAPVWTILYLMIGWVMGDIIAIWHKYKTLLAILLVNILLNLSWAPLFFHFHRIDLAFYVILAMIATLICFIFANDKDYLWSLLLAPYLLWIVFAALLNFGIFYLNK